MRPAEAARLEVRLPGDCDPLSLRSGLIVIRGWVDADGRLRLHVLAGSGLYRTPDEACLDSAETLLVVLRDWVEALVSAATSP